MYGNFVRSDSLLKIHAAASESLIALPLYVTQVPAGFPSPGEDYVDQNLDLNEHLIRHPAATFYVRARGDSMVGAGIHDGDLLVVDRSLEARSGAVVIAAVDGDLTVKRLKRGRNGAALIPDNNKYPAILITDETDLQVWGVVTHVIHKTDVRAG